MPPPIVESDAESVADELFVPAVDEIDEAEDETMNEGHEPAQMKKEDEEEEEEDGDDEDEDEETYIVEEIQDHRSDFEDGKLRYLVKWKGYEAKKDRTWEPEENLEGAKDALTEYLQKIGGKPVPGATKKRSRQSGAFVKYDPDAKTNKKPRTSNKGARKSSRNGSLEQDVNPSPMVGFTEVGDDDWKPPRVEDGSWDPLVQSVDTVVRENVDGELWAYLIWNEKSAAGRYRRSKAKLPTIYRACPQRMLHFYEKHLVFSSPDSGEVKEERPTI